MKKEEEVEGMSESDDKLKLKVEVKEGEGNPYLGSPTLIWALALRQSVNLYRSMSRGSLPWVTDIGDRPGRQ